MMSISLPIQLIMRSLSFFAIVLPLFCLLETLIIVGYMNIANNKVTIYTLNPPKSRKPGRLSTVLPHIWGGGGRIKN